MKTSPLDTEPGAESLNTRSTQFILIMGLLIIFTVTVLAAITYIWGISTIPHRIRNNQNLMDSDNQTMDTIFTIKDKINRSFELSTEENIYFHGDEYNQIKL